MCVCACGGGYVGAGGRKVLRRCGGWGWWEKGTKKCQVGRKNQEVKRAKVGGWLTS